MAFTQFFPEKIVAEGILTIETLYKSSQNIKFQLLF